MSELRVPLSEVQICGSDGADATSKLLDLLRTHEPQLLSGCR